MQKAMITALKFMMFLVTFAAGSFFPPFHVKTVVSATGYGTRIFIYDGVVLMATLAVLILLIEAIRKRVRTSAPWTLAALVLATVAGLAMKFGFMTIDR